MYLSDYSVSYLNKFDRLTKMVKLIGLILLVSSLLSLITGVFIDLRYSSSAQVTGNVVSNILMQPKISLSFYDYLEGTVFSYSIVSLIIGTVFLFMFNSKSI